MSQSGSAGDVTLLPDPTGVITWGRFAHSKETGEQTQIVMSSIGDQSVWDMDTTVGAVGERNIVKYIIRALWQKNWENKVKVSSDHL